MIVDVVDAVAVKGDDGDSAVEAKVRARAEDLCRRFPIYS